MRRRRLKVLILLAALLVPAPGRTQAELPIFDTHIHYSQPDWGTYTPADIVKILDRAGVRRALVSSTPDDGTLRLYEKASARIVPELRPYRVPGDLESWYRDPAVLAYVENRLKRGIYKGIGEFHLFGGQTQTSVIRRIVELAAEKKLILHAHSDEAAVEELFQLNPAAKILWAHAGMTSGPEAIGRMLDRHPTLWAELAFRTDMASGGKLEPAWRALFLRHPDRLMVGTDTWETSRWQELPGYLAWTRAWLAQLPPEVAEKIAFRNAERLFGP